jgi:hypothetical protein
MQWTYGSRCWFALKKLLILPILNLFNMPLKSYLLPILTLLAVTFTSCKKNPKAGEPAPQEQGLEVALTDVVASQYNAAPGSTYTFGVKVTSEMPAKGVIVKVKAETEAGAMDIPQDAIAPTMGNPISVSLKGLKALQTVKVTVTITSVSQPNNVTTTSFFITNKEPQ